MIKHYSLYISNIDDEFAMNLRMRLINVSATNASERSDVVSTSDFGEFFSLNFFLKVREY